ncbi:MAG: FAD-binding oxidoreductase [Acetobacteraceae bacterium]|nr:FAD-binding oxidoreductase [Acetobacteraceae bacterium]
MRLDALVIGGGFYGCCLAVFLRRRFRTVMVVDRAGGLLTRASRVNQARLHNGYHYPRSFLTAIRSRKNLDVFRREFPDGVVGGFTHLYAIARGDSKIGHRHFERIVRSIGAPLQPAAEHLSALFSPRLIEAVYEVEEPAFDVDVLREILSRRLDEAGVEVRLNSDVLALRQGPGVIRADMADGTGIDADWAFNCTYAGLNRIVPSPAATHPGLVHQLTEIALIEPPGELRHLAVTVMDGPFFSTMPFPSERLHSLTHVRYTPHLSWPEFGSPDVDTVALLRTARLETRFPWMMRDARRYLPAIGGARYVRSLFDIKTIPDGTSADDARPILFHRDAVAPRIVSILGGKLDNIFDVHDFVEQVLEAA